MKNKKITLVALMITFFSTDSLLAFSKRDYYAAKQACLNAPSSRKASACYKYNKMKKGAGDSSPSSKLAAAKRKCDKAPWSRKTTACYKYKKLRAAAKKEEKKKKLEEAPKVEAKVEISSSELAAAKRKCDEAPSSQKATACHEYKEIKEAAEKEKEVSEAKDTIKRNHLVREQEDI